VILVLENAEDVLEMVNVRDILAQFGVINHLGLDSAVAVLQEAVL